jgi:hypothetical protein
MNNTLLNKKTHCNGNFSEYLNQGQRLFTLAEYSGPHDGIMQQTNRFLVAEQTQTPLCTRKS